MRLVVLRTGDTPEPVARRRGEFIDFFRHHIDDAWPHSWVEFDVRGEVDFGDVRASDAFIVTGSSRSVTERAPWMLRTEAFLRAVVGDGHAVLGVCFGHQIVAQAMGGEVQQNPRGREVGTTEIVIEEGAHADPLFSGVPARFAANNSHRDSVVALPEGARVLARTAREPHAAYAIGERVRGVQFHPEFDGDVMRGYLRARRELLAGEGFDPGALEAATVDTPDAVQLMRNFVVAIASRP